MRCATSWDEGASEGLSEVAELFKDEDDYASAGHDMCNATPKVKTGTYYHRSHTWKLVRNIAMSS